MNHSPSPYVIVASLPVECFLISTCGEAAAGPAACAVPRPVETHANAAVIARKRKAPERERVRAERVSISGIIQPSPEAGNQRVPTNTLCYAWPEHGNSGPLP